MKLIGQAFSQEFEVEFIRSGLSFWEKKKIQELIQHRYSREEWIFSIKRPFARVCIQKKTPGGLLQVYLSLSKGVIEDVLISGDFFSTPENISRLESALKWTPAKRESIEKVLNRAMKDNESIYGVSVSELSEIIMEGIKKCSFNKRKARNIYA
jgi:lipoate-protein ligase A